MRAHYFAATSRVYRLRCGFDFCSVPAGRRYAVTITAITTSTSTPAKSILLNKSRKYNANKFLSIQTIYPRFVCVNVNAQLTNNT